MSMGFELVTILVAATNILRRNPGRATLPNFEMNTGRTRSSSGAVSSLVF